MLVKIYKTKDFFQFELCFLQEKETNHPSHENKEV